MLSAETNRVGGENEGSVAQEGPLKLCDETRDLLSTAPLYAAL
jgi:hypothetical protein